MAVTVVAYTGKTGTANTTFTVSNVVVAAGDRLFAWQGGAGAGGTNHAAVYNGTETLTKLDTDDFGTGKLVTYELLNPTAGTHNVVFTWTTSFSTSGGVLVVSGSDLGIAAAGSTLGTATDTAPTVTVVSAAGRLVIAAAAVRSSLITITADGAGDTRIGETVSNSGADASSHMRTWAWWSAGATSTVVSGTLSASGNWGMRGYSFSPAVAAAGPGIGSLASMGAGY